MPYSDTSRFFKNYFLLLVLVSSSFASAEETNFIENPHVFDILSVEKFRAEIDKRDQDGNASCAKYAEDWRATDECYVKYLKDYPVEVSVPLHEGPSEKTPKMGELSFSYVDVTSVMSTTVGLYKILFIENSGRSSEITSQRLAFGSREGQNLQLYTVLAQKDGWLKLPQHPFPKPVWVNFAKAGSVPKVQPLTKIEALTIKTASFSGLVSLEKIEKGVFIGRKYLDSPSTLQSCKEYGRKFKFSPPLKIAVKDLYDKNMHLKIEELPIPECIL